MSGASEAVAALRDTAETVYEQCHRAGGTFARAIVELRKTGDIVETMQATIDMLVAAEALHDASDATVKALRNTLSQQMSETGCTTVQAQHHSAHLARRPAFVSIDNEGLLPPEFVVQKPSIDKKAIAAAIKDGVEVAGASLLTPNEPVLVLRARKEQAA